MASTNPYVERPMQVWYQFTDCGGMKGLVGLGGIRSKAWFGYRRQRLFFLQLLSALSWLRHTLHLPSKVIESEHDFFAVGPSAFGPAAAGMLLSLRRTKAGQLCIGMHHCTYLAPLVTSNLVGSWGRIESIGMNFDTLFWHWLRHQWMPKGGHRVFVAVVLLLLWFIWLKILLLFWWHRPFSRLKWISNLCFRLAFGRRVVQRNEQKRRFRKQVGQLSYLKSSLRD